MRRVANTSLDLAPLEAFRASLRLWLVETLVWLTSALEPALRHGRKHRWMRAALDSAQRQVDWELRETVRDLRALLIAQAYARLRLPVEPAFRRTSRPSGLRRHVQRNSFLRKATATALKHVHAGSLRERAQRLRDMVDNTAPLIAEVHAHLTRLFIAPRLPGLIPRLLVDGVRSVAAICAPLVADTS